MEAGITDFGAALTRLSVSGVSGKRVDMLLGFSCVEEYTRHPNYFGAVAGRIAGRIPQGRFPPLTTFCNPIPEPL
ncbi:MAG: hypothetical protein JJU00_16215 [Opitutales bacterium]|nr:hypothetical protein [Opitutales bacterium]